VDIYRRNLQKVYIDALVTLVGNLSNARVTSPAVASPVSPSDAGGIARTHLIKLKSEISKVSVISTGITKAHFVDLLAFINETLDPKK